MKLVLNFNSIKVRLKPTPTIPARAMKTFQFHKGTIETRDGIIVNLHLIEFQFHKGTIETIRIIDLDRDNIHISIP